MEDGYINLAAAIVIQAQKDYRSALRTDNQFKITAIERFFLSDWGQLLSADHGEYIIKKERQGCLNESNGK